MEYKFVKFQLLPAHGSPRISKNYITPKVPYKNQLAITGPKFKKVKRTTRNTSHIAFVQNIENNLFFISVKYIML
jgi:hypothetical protein